MSHALALGDDPISCAQREMKAAIDDARRAREGSGVHVQATFDDTLGASRRAPRVLILEDEASVSKVLGDLVYQLGGVPILATSVLETCKLLRDPEVKITHAIVDWQLRNERATMAIAALEATRAEVFIFTGYADDPDLDSLKAKGMPVGAKPDVTGLVAWLKRWQRP